MSGKQYALKKSKILDFSFRCLRKHWYGCHVHKNIQCKHRMNFIWDFWVSSLDLWILIQVICKFLASLLYGQKSFLVFFFGQYGSREVLEESVPWNDGKLSD